VFVFLLPDPDTLRHGLDARPDWFEVIHLYGIVSIAEVHAIVASAHRAQSEPEIARLLAAWSVIACHPPPEPLSSVMKSHFSDGYLEIGSVLASVFGSVGRTIQER
jgi:hypothetical protein